MPPIESDQLKADRLKAGGIQPGTWALNAAEVVQASANGVNVTVTYSRRGRASQVLSKYEAVVLVVRRNDAWRVQAISTMGT